MDLTRAAAGPGTPDVEADDAGAAGDDGDDGGDDDDHGDGGDDDSNSDDADNARVPIVDAYRHEPADWSVRELCVDGACIGVVHGGVCNACGRRSNG